MNGRLQEVRVSKWANTETGEKLFGLIGRIGMRWATLLENDAPVVFLKEMDAIAAATAVRAELGLPAPKKEKAP